MQSLSKIDYTGKKTFHTFFLKMPPLFLLILTNRTKFCYNVDFNIQSQVPRW